MSVPFKGCRAGLSVQGYQLGIEVVGYGRFNPRSGYPSAITVSMPARSHRKFSENWRIVA